MTKGYIAFSHRGDDVLIVVRWLAKWRDRLSSVSHNYGCGWGHSVYCVEGPQEAFEELPKQVLARGRTWWSKVGG
jgi:hypothetical protein